MNSRFRRQTLNLQLVDVRATLLDPVDLRGPHKVHDDRAEWCPPAFLPTDGEGVLFLDELAQAPPQVQSACLQLVFDRRIGEYELPDGWSVIAASNRSEDRAGTHRLISPLLNRFVHLDLDVCSEDWHDWVVRHNVLSELRAILWASIPQFRKQDWMD
jgi:MoxR-like ATPase